MKFALLIIIASVYSVPCTFQGAAVTECMDDVSCCGFVSQGVASSFCCSAGSVCCPGMNVSLCCGSLQICPSDPMQTVCNECPVTGVLIKDSLPHDRDVSVVLGASSSLTCGGLIPVPGNCLKATESTFLEIASADFVHWQLADVLLQVTSFQDDLVFGPETSAQEGVSAHAQIVGNSVQVRFEGSSDICTLPADLGGFSSPVQLQTAEAGMLLAVADPVSTTRIVNIELTYSCPSGPVRQAQTATYTRQGFDYLRPVLRTVNFVELEICSPQQVCLSTVAASASGNNLSTVDLYESRCYTAPFPSAQPTILATSSPTGSPTLLPTAEPPTIPPTISPTPAPRTLAPTAATIPPSAELPKTRFPTQGKKTNRPSKSPTSFAPTRTPVSAAPTLNPSKPPTPVGTIAPTNALAPTETQQDGGTPSESDGMSGVVAGIVSAVVVLFLISMCICLRVRSRKQKRKGQPYRNLGYYEPPTINSVSS